MDGEGVIGIGPDDPLWTGAARPFSQEAARWLRAARCPASMREGTFGPWQLERRDFGKMVGMESGRFVQTILHRYTEATLHRTVGEIVMEDSPRELRRHLGVWIAAGRPPPLSRTRAWTPGRRHGWRVLVTGLGLGCVVRGLLRSPWVQHIDVVEICPHIIAAVGDEFAGSRRVTIHHGDALTYEWPDGTSWDFAWHDLWVEGAGLQLLHVKVMTRYLGMARRQGAWRLPRMVGRRRANPVPFLGSPRRSPAAARPGFVHPFDIERRADG